MSNHRTVVIHVRPFPARRILIPEGEDPAKIIAAAKAALRAQRPGSLAEDLQHLLDTMEHGKAQANARSIYRFWASRFPARARATITTQEVQAAVDDLRLSAKSKKHYRDALAKAYRVLNGLGGYNPCVGIQLPRQPEPPPRGVAYGRLVAVFDHMRPSATKNRLQLIAYFGLRPSEIARLTPEDFQHDGIHVATGKGGQFRILPVVTQLQKQLVKEFLRRARFGPMSTSSMYKSWKLAQLGLPGRFIRPYDLRHSFGTAIYRATGDIRITAEALGHRQLKTSMRYTNAVVPEMLRNAMAALVTAPVVTRKAKPRKSLSVPQ